jgi:hypothetical protein
MKAAPFEGPRAAPTVRYRAKWTVGVIADPLVIVVISAADRDRDEFASLRRTQRPSIRTHVLSE